MSTVAPSVPDFLAEARLKYSRLVAVTLVPNEQVETIVRCLARDFVAFGGLPLMAVFDRPRTIVAKGGVGRDVEQYNATFAQAIVELGVGVEMCAPRSGNQKGSVERLVGWVKSSFFKPRKFQDGLDLRAQLAAWIVEANTKTPSRATGVLPETRRLEELRRLRPIKVLPENLMLRIPVFVGPTAEVMFEGVPYTMPPEATHVAGTLFLYEDRLRIVAGRFEATHRRRRKGEPAAPLPEHRAAKIAAVHGERAKLYEKRQALLDLGPDALALLTEITHRAPRRPKRDVEDLYVLLETHGDDVTARRNPARSRARSTDHHGCSTRARRRRWSQFMTTDLDVLLKRLHLANARRVWRDMVQRAEKEQWSHDALLHTLFAEEVAHRRGTRLTRAVRAAQFPFLRTVEEFDFTYQSTLRLTTIGSLLAPDFVTEGRSVILEGKPGRGKTHLALAIAYRALQNGFDARFTTAAELIEDLSSASHARVPHARRALVDVTTCVPTCSSSTRSATSRTAPTRPTSSTTWSTTDTSSAARWSSRRTSTRSVGGTRSMTTISPRRICPDRHPSSRGGQFVSASPRRPLGAHEGHLAPGDELADDDQNDLWKGSAHFSGTEAADFPGTYSCRCRPRSCRFAMWPSGVAGAERGCGRSVTSSARFVSREGAHADRAGREKMDLRRGASRGAPKWSVGHAASARRRTRMRQRNLSQRAAADRTALDVAPSQLEDPGAVALRRCGHRGGGCGQEGTRGGALVGRGVQTNAADLVEAVGQHVLHEASEKLDLRDRLEPVTLRAEGHALVGDIDEAAVRDGDAMRVAPEIAEHVRGAVEGGLRVDDPALPRDDAHEPREAFGVLEVVEASELAVREGVLQRVDHLAAQHT